MLRRTCFFMTVVCFLLCGFLVCAQSEASAKVEDKLKAAEQALKRVEVLTSQIERGKVLTDKQIAELDKAMEESARLTGSALQEALDDTRKEAKEVEAKKKAKIEMRSLKAFEKSAKSFEARAKRVEQQSKGINEKLKKGEIKLDKAALQKLKGKDKEEFEKFLEPKARRQYSKLYPEIFKPEKRAQIIKPVVQWCRQVFATLGNFFVSPAHAAIGAKVCLTCGGSGPAAAFACAKALSEAQAEYDRAYREYRSCYYSCPWWSSYFRSRCLALYLAKCA